MPCAPGASRAWTVMPRPPEKSSGRKVNVVAALAVLLAASSVRCEEYDPAGAEEPHIKLTTIVEAGAAIAIGSDLCLQPELGCVRDLPASWQLGRQARLDPGDAKIPYDYRPQVNLAARKLWLGDEDNEPIRNSEYFGVSLGGFY